MPCKNWTTRHLKLSSPDISWQQWLHPLSSPDISWHRWFHPLSYPNTTGYIHYTYPTYLGKDGYNIIIPWYILTWMVTSIIPPEAFLDTDGGHYPPLTFIDKMVFHFSSPDISCYRWLQNYPPLTYLYIYLTFRFFKEEVGPVLFDWRQSRGFEKGSIHVSMGQLRI